MPVVFDADASTTAEVSLADGGVATTLAAATLAADLTAALARKQCHRRQLLGSAARVLPDLHLLLGELHNRRHRHRDCRSAGGLPRAGGNRHRLARPARHHQRRDRLALAGRRDRKPRRLPDEPGKSVYRLLEYVRGCDGRPDAGRRRRRREGVRGGLFDLRRNRRLRRPKRSPPSCPSATKMPWPPRR